MKGCDTITLTVRDQAGCYGEVEVWYSESTDSFSYDTPPDHSIYLERWKVITEDSDPEFDPSDGDIQDALEEELM